MEALQHISKNLFLKNYSVIEADKKSIVNRFFHLFELNHNLTNGEIEYWKLSNDEKQAFNKNTLDRYFAIEMLKIIGDYFEVIKKCYSRNEFTENYYPVIIDDFIKEVKMTDVKCINYFIAFEKFLSAS